MHDEVAQYVGDALQTYIECSGNKDNKYVLIGFTNLHHIRNHELIKENSHGIVEAGELVRGRSFCSVESYSAACLPYSSLNVLFTAADIQQINVKNVSVSNLH